MTSALQANVKSKHWTSLGKSCSQNSLEMVQGLRNAAEEVWNSHFFSLELCQGQGPEGYTWQINIGFSCSEVFAMRKMDFRQSFLLQDHLFWFLLPLFNKGQALTHAMYLAFLMWNPDPRATCLLVMNRCHKNKAQKAGSQFPFYERLLVNSESCSNTLYCPVAILLI